MVNKQYNIHLVEKNDLISDILIEANYSIKFNLNKNTPITLLTYIYTHNTHTHSKYIHIYIKR